MTVKDTAEPNRHPQMERRFCFGRAIACSETRWHLPPSLTFNTKRYIAFGPNDLAADLGFPGQPGHEKVIDLHTKIEKLSRNAGKLIVGDYCKTIRFEDAALDVLKRFKEE